MKISMFRSMTETGLNRKVNQFLEDSNVEVINIKFSMTIFDCGALVMYKEKE
ncbi:hypothetical protein NQ095_05670 [Rossellomorea sp. SC111]|uniref:hypothetical protein n=1 Tax=Rossellomorea sp. SC111 TaxID=2968985 RepID=UPI00215A2BAA|nr:hypothetical protein [Rossellomorea sp. SC111]MCR8847887.1 hypothetical protein [Rossellomorea sp. SC111]